MAAAFNAHQRRDDARGRLLGPDAVAAAVEGFRRLGAEVIVRPSPWRLGAADADLAAEWFSGWVAAACEQDAGLAADADAYARRRLARRRPGSSRSPSTTPTCWCCRERRRPSRLSSAGVGWARVAGAAATLAVLVWRLGTGPFLDGLRSGRRPRARRGGSPSRVLTTVCCAWRWRIVARGLGIDLPLPRAVAAYYRSLFLNVTLPGGVVGDVHRGDQPRPRRAATSAAGCAPSRGSAPPGRSCRSSSPSSCCSSCRRPCARPCRSSPSALVAAAVAVVLVDRARPGGARPLGASRRTAAATSATACSPGGRGRRSRSRRRSSSLGHAVTFLIAARTAGATAPASRLLPLALLALLAMVLPSIAGWGPREGATAWAFAAAGLGAEHGVATAVVYGVMVLVASLPGRAVLVVAGSVERAVADARIARGRARAVADGRAADA